MAAELLHPPPKPPTSDANEAADVAGPAAVRLDNPVSNVAPKRQRRPSVRLGEIGDQPATSQDLKSCKFPHSKSSKIRPLTNLANNSNKIDGSSEFHNPFDRNGNLKEFKGKRARTNWTTFSRIDETELAEAPSIGGDLDERENEQFKHFTREDWESSPVRSSDNLAPDTCYGHNRRSLRCRIADPRDRVAALELDGISESDSRHRSRRSNDRNRSLDVVVRNWLIELGLERYAAVFEMHQVDEQVLPFLTLEDLKDMGINAVGSRRKIYSAIQKLRRDCVE